MKESAEGSNRGRVLVIGAGGFTGGFIADEGLRRGYEVTAGVRATTSRRYLSDERLSFLEIDFTDAATVRASLSRGLEEQGGPWRYIIYNLGATKCLNFMDFNRINHDYLDWTLTALKELGAAPEKLIFVSSLSVMGAGDEKGYTPFTEKMPAQPNTRYGTSKLKGELTLQASGIPYIIVRATGIYGPRERDYYLMFKSISRGVDFSVGMRRQELTFLYVEDLARALYDALERSAAGELYLLAEGRSYTQKEFRAISQKAIGRRWVVPIKAPLWLLKCVSRVAQRIGQLRGKPSTLNADKYNIMRQRNWRVATAHAREGFGFEAQVGLEEGVRRAVEWYRKEGWLRKP